ncbi:amidohydrolase family protein [Nocardia terpenica]|uniref:Amidohydrolase family protein n=2 Tax=Nocardia terpenica TaxID=455432 RepID=A0A6G9ZAD3_9NOCA|nr:amidohydrolase family protein [Nocardia terpenica]
MELAGSLLRTSGPLGEGAFMALPKIAVEEAFHQPDEVTRILADEQKFQQICAQAGLTPEFYRPRLERLADFGEARLKTMDAGGIQHAVLSLTAPGIQAILDPREAADEAERANDLLAREIARNPDRYSGFAAVALQDPACAIAELRRGIGELGFKGVMINGYTNVGSPERGAYLDEPQFDEFLSAVTELDVPLYLHPRPALPGWGAIDGHPELLGATWGFGPETATHVLRLIFGGAFDRHPRLKLILGHLGEGLPALLWRTQYNFDLNPFGKRIERTLPEYFSDNIWLTTSGNFSDQALLNALTTVGADHVLFSVDYPYADTELAARWIENTPISETDRRKIASGNACALLGLPEPQNPPN